MHQYDDGAGLIQKEIMYINVSAVLFWIMLMLDHSNNICMNCGSNCVYILSRKVFITAVTEKNSKKNLNLCIKDNVKTLVQFLFFPRQVVCETLECGGRAKIRHLVVIISIRKLKKRSHSCQNQLQNLLPACVRLFQKI